jgi:hypothetical protein
MVAGVVASRADLLHSNGLCCGVHADSDQVLVQDLGFALDTRTLQWRQCNPKLARAWWTDHQPALTQNF